MLSPVAALKAELKALNQKSIETFNENNKVHQLLTHLRSNVDTILTKAWDDAQLPSSMALVAVGGYGRGELFPNSDVDVLILLKETPTTEIEEILSNLIQLFWDIGLEIGHSIRTVDECLKESAGDITIQTSLLEARLVTGNEELFDELTKRYKKAMNPRAFFQEKTLEMHQRHLKYEDTPYSLEPNCKESPGGLRDLQVILWICKAANLGHSWHELAQKGLLTPTEARQLTLKEHVIKNIRTHLHLITHREEDRLVFDIQPALAEALGYKSTDTRRSSEYLMQRYYLAAKTVVQLNNILLQNIESRLFPQANIPQKINDRFNELNGFIDISHDNVFEETPSAMLEVFYLMTQHPELKDMTARTLRALWHTHFKINHAFRRDPVNQDFFIKILQAKHGIYHALRRMNQTSVLSFYLPNFRKIVGQMQHDLFHVYTVDQHIMMVVRNVRRFTMSEHAHEYPFCSQLMANFGQPWVLYTAALFHDIAKGRGGDHSKLGMVDARRFCERHRISKENTDLIVFLVENHLTMSQIAQKRDLSDPEVIKEFADLVKDERHLTALYLLTVADIRGTSPKVWNNWKGKLLEDLYRITLRVLGGEEPSNDRELKNTQDEALRILRNEYGLPPDAHEAFWKKLDITYFLRNDASNIAWQTYSFYKEMNSESPLVKCRSEEEGIQIAVYTKDHNDLFTQICSYFDNQNFNILDAKIHTTKLDYALDSFLVEAPALTEDDQDILDTIEQELTALIKSDQPVPVPPKGRLSRQSRTFPIKPNVILRPDEKGHYLLFISSNDRNGLLFTISSILTKYKITIHTAKITTLGERVEDVFLVDGEALNSPRTQIQLESELIEALSISK